MAFNIMIQGTMSSAGKSILAAGLCRVFAQDGYRTAPFKSQNMALNSFVTEDGLEMGRAQVVQAEACGRSPDVRMNPVLLKPTTDIGSQVIVHGRARGHMAAGEYFKYKKNLIPEIMEAYTSLDAENDILVIEGAGSPAEINLKSGDIVNMGLAEMVDAPVLLVGDIDRGGVFAQLLGTVELLEPQEKARICGLIINKFRGDRSILEPGLRMIEERCGIPVLGVIPWIDIDLDDEDSLTERFQKRSSGSAPGEDAVTDAGMVSHSHTGSFRKVITDDGSDHAACDAVTTDRRSNGSPAACRRMEPGTGADAEPGSARELMICVIRLPRISNFSDFTVFETIPGVRLLYADRPAELADADLIILPGTRSTMQDLIWMKQRGLEEAVIRAARKGIPIVGVCGGYQMLGEWIRDPEGEESSLAEIAGLGLLPLRTVFSREKTTCQVSGRILKQTGLLEGCSGLPVKGYEIHQGQSYLSGRSDSCPVSGASENHTIRRTLDCPDAGSPDSHTTGCMPGLPGSPAPAPPRVGLSAGRTPDYPDAGLPDSRTTSRIPGLSSTPAGHPDADAGMPGGAAGRALAMLHTAEEARTGGGHADGMLRGNVFGTYMHGIFDNPAFTGELLRAVASARGLDRNRFAVPDPEASREAQFDRLADTIRESLDLDMIREIMFHWPENPKHRKRTSKNGNQISEARGY